MAKFLDLYHKCRTSGSSLPIVVTRHLYFRLRHKNIVAHQRATIRGLRNIETGALLRVGVGYVGFMHKADRTLLAVKGQLRFGGDFAIVRGCRFDIGEGATASFGTGYVNANSIFVILHRLEIGDGCAIGWNCLFLDDDFHHLEYEGRKESSEGIRIGKHVWIGCNSTVLKGTVIPDGCVVAANSVVRGKFDESNALIAGNPARVIKHNVRWR